MDEQVEDRSLASHKDFAPLAEYQSIEANGQHGIEAEPILLKCRGCKSLLYTRELSKNHKVCPDCGYHFHLRASERIQQLLDKDSFVELASDMCSLDPLHFTCHAYAYSDKLQQEQIRSTLRAAVITGHGSINGYPLALAVMDFHFMGGSMDSAVGEKIACCVEYAVAMRIPLVIVSTSGGARMQEGVYSLMQMAKTVFTLNQLAKAGLLFISILADPTMGGVAASFAALGDIILAEPGARIGFAGPRVIEQFMHQSLPKEAHTAEFAFRHGMIDAVVARHELRSRLARLLYLYRH